MTEAKFWDRIAPKYAAQPIKNPQAYEYTLGRTRSYIKSSDHVLELGCGTASTAIELAPLAAQYTASDLSAKMVEIGTQKAQAAAVGNLTCMVADWSSPRLQEQTYSVVLALNLLHLLPDLPAVLARVHSLLPQGGLFISKTVVVPTAPAPLSFRLMRLALPLLHRLGRVPFVAFRQAPDLDRAIEEAGFEIIETSDGQSTPPNRYIVARKL